MEDSNANLGLVRRNLTFKSDEPEIAESYWDFHLTMFNKVITLMTVFYPKRQLGDGTENNSKDNFRLFYQISPVIMAKEVNNALDIVDCNSIYAQTKQHYQGRDSMTNTKNYMGIAWGNVWGNGGKAHHNGTNLNQASRAYASFWRNIFPTLNQTLTDAGDDVNDFTIKFQIKINILKSPFVDSDC